MKKFCCLLSVACALLLFSLPLAASDAPASLSQEQIEAIAIQPVNNWSDTQRVPPEMLPLFKEESIKLGDETVKYRLHVPENMEPGKKYPLLLWLHGAGERGTDNKLQLVHLHHIITYLTGEKKRDFFLLVPQYRSNEWWGQSDRSSQTIHAHVPSEIKDNADALKKHKEMLLEQIKASTPKAEVAIEERRETMTIQRRTGGVLGIGARVVEEEREELMLRITIKTGENDKDHPLERAYAMIDQVAENYPVDMNRITVSGLSTGGDGTWRALERRPNLFAAAVPLVSWTSLSDDSMEQSPILKKIPIWAIYSSDDRSIDSAREQFERAEKSGANVKKTEFGICGHHAWTPAMLQADIFAWLLSRAKDGDRFYAVYDPGVDPDDLKGIVEVATRDTSPAPALAPAVESSSDGSPPALREVEVQVAPAQTQERGDVSLPVISASISEQQKQRLQEAYENLSKQQKQQFYVEYQKSQSQVLAAFQGYMQERLKALTAEQSPERKREIEAEIQALVQEHNRMVGGMQIQEQGDVSPPVVPTAISDIQMRYQEKQAEVRAALQEEIDVRLNAFNAEQSPERKRKIEAEIQALVREHNRMVEGMRIQERGGVSPPVRLERVITGGLIPPALAPEVAERMNRDREQAYTMMAVRYFQMMNQSFGTDKKEEATAHLERFARIFRKLPPPEQMKLTVILLGIGDMTTEAMEVLEKLIDAIPAAQERGGVSPPVPPPPVRIERVITGGLTPPAPAPPTPAPPAPMKEPETPIERATAPVAAPVISAAKIIEECDRPWAMTSESLYGMFPADWGKEAEAIPDFIVNSTLDELSHRLARSVSEDTESKDFIAACRSILVLQHRPMSSPWFETAGGRLRSEIQYSLSAKGQMFVRFLRAVKDSKSTDKARELSKVAERTLAKIDMVLAKD